MEKMNNKGVVSIMLALFILILVVGTLAIISFFVSTHFRYILIGIGILAGSFWLIGNMLQGKVTGKKVFLILIIVGVGLFFIFGSNILQTAYGSTYLSIDKVDLVGDGERIIINGVAGRGAENINIDFDKNNINNQLEGEGYMVDRGVVGSIDLVKWEHQFLLTQTSSNLYELATQYEYGQTCNLNLCVNKGLDAPIENYITTYMVEDYTWPRDNFCACVYYKPLAEVRDFSSGSSNIDYYLGIDIDGQKAYLNENNPSTSLYNGDVKVEFTGLSSSTTQLNAPGYDVVFQNGQYKGLVMNDASSYRGIGNPENYMLACTGGSHDKSVVQGCYEKYYRDTSIAIQSKTDEYITDANLKSVTYRDNQLIVEPEAVTFYPQFKITLNADWVGIKELIGTPKITECANDIVLDSGDSDRLELSVKNVGDEEGMFNYKAECDNGLSITPTSKGVASGDTETFTVSVTGSTSNVNGVKGTCKHTVTDQKSGDSDSCVSGFEVDYTNFVCSPGTKKCDENVLEECNSLGTNWDTVDCEFGCGYNADKDVVECATSPGECGNGVCEVGETFNTCSQDCEQPVCGDGTCELEETNTCPQDCGGQEISCSWYQYKTTENQVIRNWWNYIGIGKPKIISTPVCKTSGWVYGVITGVVILLLGVTAIRVYKPKKKKK